MLYIAFVPYLQSQCQQMGFSLCKVQHNNNNNNNNGVPGGTGGSEKLNSTPRHDTLRDGRKGDPQHKCCGENVKTQNK